jgi:exodeoxyribonuclease V alpha subunit
MVRIRGQLEKIIFRNEENNYTVAMVNPESELDSVTITGILYSPNPGQMLEMEGEWTEHPRFGTQFQVDRYRIGVPVTEEGIRRYLGSGMIPHIGEKMADRIVDAFGTEALDIIEHAIERLSEVEGIGKKRIKIITEAWEKQKDIREVMLFLQEHHVSTHHGIKIFNTYGKQAIEMVQANPYRLADDIFGIGFKTADRIAQRLGFDEHSLQRAEAGTLYLLHSCIDQGHTCYPEKQLETKCKEEINIDEDLFQAALRRLIDNNRVIFDTSTVDKPMLYTKEMFKYENGIAEEMHRLSENAFDTGTTKVAYCKNTNGVKNTEWKQTVEVLIERIAQREKLKPSEKQFQAVYNTAAYKLSVLTGGPGTGKTTITRMVILLAEQLGWNYLLCAPTGRAAKRLSESTGREAKTIHRLLEYDPKKAQFKRNKSNHLITDLIIIDETSMVDIVLGYHLLSALCDRARVLFIGDTFQLPSIGPGEFLHSIIESSTICVVELREIFRQAVQSTITINAHRIKTGQFPYTDEDNELTDFYFIKQSNPEKMAEMVAMLALERVPGRFGFHPIKEIQVLTPMHKGAVGTKQLNALLQETLNSNGEQLDCGGQTFRLGDKVMQIRNNYDKEVFNGDIGTVIAMNREKKEMTVEFDERSVSYEAYESDELIPAYAISIHKAQGSEYPAVIIPLATEHYILLQRNLLYTAVTRGKQLVVLIGSPKALSIALKRENRGRRYTLLGKRLKKRFDSEDRFQ